MGAGLITQRFHDRSQEMSDQLRSMSASGGGIAGTTNRHHNTTYPMNRTGIVYSAFGAGTVARPAPGEIILDRLDIDVPEFVDPDSANPQKAFNLTSVPIPVDDRVICWFDPSAESGDIGDKSPAGAWYVGGVKTDEAPPAIVPTAILTQGSFVSPYSQGDPPRDQFFQLKRTNDSSTFGFMNGDVENPVNNFYDGIKVNRPGDYTIRWGYAAEVIGNTLMGPTDDAMPFWEWSRWLTSLHIYKSNPLVIQDFSIMTTPCTLVYFANVRESKTFSGFEDWSLDAERIIRLYLEQLSTYIRIEIRMAYLEITRIGPLTDVAV